MDYTDAIATIRAPTLLIWGDADAISPVAAGRRLAQLLPNSKQQVLPGGIHSLAYDRPGAQMADRLGRSPATVKARAAALRVQTHAD